ncbi:DNA-dependent metalloprotease SPRTN isoform X2 [Tiliqua scincoides]
MCSIRLSEPLLKLRPRKDLIETLLHEMIHALLFVTNNDKDRDSHGPEFCKHMHRINRLTGANVTIYHEFHDEVDSYRQHWWRCDGPCKSRKPYFGYVKRAMNRAPSANDFWWSEHQQTCGGTFTKVKEPENYSKKGKEKNQQAEFQANDKGRTRGSKIQSTIPFSGKGYVLGGKHSMFLSERTTSPSNSKSRELQISQHDLSADSVRLNRKNETDLEQNVPNTNIFPLFSWSGNKNSCASSVTLPKFSVANTKVYTNVNGSPARNVSFDRGKSNRSSANAKSGLLVTGTPKRDNPEQTISSPRSWTTSQGSDGMHTFGGPPKRAKMEDMAAFKAYFTKGMEPGWTSPSVKKGAEVEQICLEKSATSESNQNRKVSCPVCHSEVLEAKINEHLDSCLQEPLK